MQSRDALSRNEANAASDAADDLSTSMNRGERLKAIEQKITKLKADADTKAAAAQSAAASAQQERDALNKLRADGESQRSTLESRKSELSDAAAQEAAQQVILQSQLDSLNEQWTAEQEAAAQQVQQVTPQGTTRPAGTTTPAQPSTPSQPAQPVTPSQPAQPSRRWRKPAQHIGKPQERAFRRRGAGSGTTGDSAIPA